MASQLYGETLIAECLYEVLGEMVEEQAITEHLAEATLEQVSSSVLNALVNQVPAKADFKATLSSYKYLDNVWQFVMTNVTFRLNPTGTGSIRKGFELTSPALKMICVDSKLAAVPGTEGAAGGSGGVAVGAAAGGDATGPSGS